MKDHIERPSILCAESSGTQLRSVASLFRRWNCRSATVAKCGCLIFCWLVLAGHVTAQRRGIIDNSQSPHVKLRSIDIGDCRWTEGFWADKFKLCEEVRVPHMETILKGDIGFAYDNFKIAAGVKECEHQGMVLC